MISRLGSLSGNIVQFCRFLRTKDYTVGTEEEISSLKALEYIDFTNPDEFLLAMKATLCKSKKQLNEFDELFFTYWKELKKAVDSKRKEEKTPKKNTPGSSEQFKSLSSWLKGSLNNEAIETASYSSFESLSKKDFSTVPDDEIDELMKLLKSLSRQLAARAKRRYEKTANRNFPDIRLTLRKNLRRGGELIDIVYRKPKKNRVKIIILCDVSRSMELYSAFLLQFMYAFQKVYSRVESFAFSTSLKRITSMMKEYNFRDVLESLSNESSGWNGGTRIGESLETFSREYAEKLLDRKTIVIILSDGWDTGDSEMLSRNMENIHNRAGKLIWLNPLAGYEAFQPEVTGIKTAMPYIDVFAPAHNASSLRKIFQVGFANMKNLSV